ncbi:hypothetical protein ACQR1Y_34600 [Bradyrhizobium sp. HKCCYLRH3099]|uniref:hypothetical protein n=1 Tax=unclassified Bradyrhizobium TaxID=2631580 RepID=UPI003EBAB4C5
MAEAAGASSLAAASRFMGRQTANNQNIASLEINGASIGRVPGGIVVTLSVMVDRPDDAIAAGRDTGARRGDFWQDYPYDRTALPEAIWREATA